MATHADVIRALKAKSTAAGRAGVARFFHGLPGDTTTKFLGIRRHDRIDNWDLVDRAAAHVVGGYLVDRPRTVLHTLARSTNPWKRRTAIVATWYFIRRNGATGVSRRRRRSGRSALSAMVRTGSVTLRHGHRRSAARPRA